MLCCMNLWTVEVLSIVPIEMPRRCMTLRTMSEVVMSW